MKRAGFKPRAPHREARDPDRVRSVPTVSAGAWRAPRVVGAMPAAQVDKAAPVRSEASRRAVASLPYHNQPQRFADKRLMLSILNQRSKV